MTKEKTEKKKDGVTFDMYHFFSRKDVILAVLVILAFLLYALSLFFMGEKVV